MDLRNIEQKFWEKELELIAEDNDFLLGLLASLQTEQVITHKYDEKIWLFFNHFQYFFNQTKHLKEGLQTLSTQDLLTKKRRNAGLREEINCLIEKFEIFKNNFKTFLGTLSIHKPIFTYYL